MCLSHAERHGVRAEHAPDAECADRGADVLGDPVNGDLSPGKPPGDCKGEGHRRVDVAAGDLADGVDKRRDDEAESEADPQQVSFGHGRHRFARQGQGRDHRTGPDQDQGRRAQDFSQETLSNRVHRRETPSLILTSVRHCRIGFAKRTLPCGFCQEKTMAPAPVRRERTWTRPRCVNAAPTRGPGFGGQTHARSASNVLALHPACATSAALRSRLAGEVPRLSARR